MGAQKKDLDKSREAEIAVVFTNVILKLLDELSHIADIADPYRVWGKWTSNASGEFEFYCHLECLDKM